MQTTTAAQHAITALSTEERARRRLAINKTQTDVARECGVSMTTMRLWELAVVTPSPDNAEKYLRALDLPVEDATGRKGA